MKKLLTSLAFAASLFTTSTSFAAPAPIYDCLDLSNDSTDEHFMWCTEEENRELFDYGVSIEFAEYAYHNAQFVSASSKWRIYIRPDGRIFNVMTGDYFCDYHAITPADMDDGLCKYADRLVAAKLNRVNANGSRFYVDRGILYCDQENQTFTVGLPLN